MTTDEKLQRLEGRLVALSARVETLTVAVCGENRGTATVIRDTLRRARSAVDTRTALGAEIADHLGEAITRIEERLSRLV